MAGADVSGFALEEEDDDDEERADICPDSAQTPSTSRSSAVTLSGSELQKAGSSAAACPSEPFAASPAAIKVR